MVSVLLLTLLSSPVDLPKKVSAQLKAEPVVVEASSTKARDGIAGLPGLRAQMLVRCQKQTILDTLWDLSRFTEVFPNIESVRPLQTGPNWVDAEFSVNAIVKTVHYTLHRVLNPAKGTIWWRERGGDLQTVRGRWVVRSTAHAGVSEVIYESFVVVNAWVPTSMIRRGAISATRDLGGRLRTACAARALRAANAK